MSDRLLWSHTGICRCHVSITRQFFVCLVVVPWSGPPLLNCPLVEQGCSQVTFVVSMQHYQRDDQFREVLNIAQQPRGQSWHWAKYWWNHFLGRRYSPIRWTSGPVVGMLQWSNTVPAEEDSVQRLSHLFHCSVSWINTWTLQLYVK